jgi:hypothetical protein
VVESKGDSSEKPTDTETKQKKKKKRTKKNTTASDQAPLSEVGVRL